MDLEWHQNEDADGTAQRNAQNNQDKAPTQGRKQEERDSWLRARRAEFLRIKNDENKREWQVEKARLEKIFDASPRDSTRLLIKALRR